MKQIQRNRIPDLIEEITKRGARPFSVVLITEPLLRSKSRDSGLPCPWKRITKLQMVNCFLNVNYEAAVNRQREREGVEPNFKVKPNWFTHTKTKGIVQHLKTERLYLQLKVEKVIEAYFFDDNTEVAREVIAEYLPLRSFPANQGVDKPVLTMTPALDSIKAFKVDGEIYSIGFIPELIPTLTKKEPTWTTQTLKQ